MAFLLAATTATAAERVIKLVDGSEIRGNVVAMANDSFTVKTRLLGTLTIKASQIVSMAKPGAAPGPAGARTSRDKNGAIASIQSGIVGNTALMSDILRLQNDPQIKAVLNDPHLMKAVQNMDFEKLAKDPRIKALMNNPTVKDIQSNVH